MSTASADSSTAAREAAARLAFAYLSETDPLPAAPVDAVIGFGVFDLSLPVFCGELYVRGLASRIIFTGGIGAGTADLGQPEADAWCQALWQAYPEIPAAHVIAENRSTNTAENISFTADLLARSHPDHALGTGIRQALIVAAPSRLRRTRLTLQKLQPAVRPIRCLPSRTFDQELALYTSKGLDYVAHLAGELDRIVAYPARGWIIAEPLPPALAAAQATLRSGA